MNLVPTRYRAVAVTDVDAGAPLDEESLRARFLGRPAYRRTRYIVVRAGERAAVVGVDKRSEHPLFSEITTVRLLAAPEQTAYLRSPETDVGVPSQLARAAAEGATGIRCVVVQGRHEHVNLIVDPSPVRVHVVEVAPPWPPKLLDQASRVLDLADDLPPVELVPEIIDLADLAAQRPSAHYLLPCRGSGVEIAGAEVSFLDEIPERADWTLIGCTRSRDMHRWFYGEDVPTVQMCPRELTGRRPTPPDAVLLTKCCMREEGIETAGRVVVVPWGASLAEIRDGLVAAIDVAGGTIAAHAT